MKIAKGRTNQIQMINDLHSSIIRKTDTFKKWTDFFNNKKNSGKDLVMSLKNYNYDKSNKTQRPLEIPTPELITSMEKIENYRKKDISFNNNSKKIIAVGTIIGGLILSIVTVLEDE